MPLSDREAQQLLERLAALENQLNPQASKDTKVIDINDYHVKVPFMPYPANLYRVQSPVNPAQVDHPGFDAILAKTDAEAQALIAQGWSVSTTDATKAAADVKTANTNTATKVKRSND